MLKNFRWEEEGVALAGAPQTSDEAEWLARQGIAAIFSMAPAGDAAERRLQELGVRVGRYHTESVEALDPDSLAKLLLELNEERAAGSTVLIH